MHNNELTVIKKIVISQVVGEKTTELPRTKNDNINDQVIFFFFFLK